MKALAVLVLTGLTLCLAPCGRAQGQASAHAVQAPALVLAAAHPLSLDQAVALVEQRFHARVVRADARSENGHTVYVLRLLNESGRVWTVRVDAESGAIH